MKKIILFLMYSVCIFSKPSFVLEDINSDNGYNIYKFTTNNYNKTKDFIYFFDEFKKIKTVDKNSEITLVLSTPDNNFYSDRIDFKNGNFLYISNNKMYPKNENEFIKYKTSEYRIFKKNIFYKNITYKVKSNITKLDDAKLISGKIFLDNKLFDEKFEKFTVVFYSETNKEIFKVIMDEKSKIRYSSSAK